ncbi:hypothetical protein NDU88_000071 [Pleurodeles waltl]|uniref:Uncharacterized protein n=1 Tax=Pleurodeles waltl TaxID=8319 RepID=A0AAV7L5B0_PLEWA|nr:hypothetical protein NDU88_000071 [Pleurodeles waltl]
MKYPAHILTQYFILRISITLGQCQAESPLVNTPANCCSLRPWHNLRLWQCREPLWVLRPHPLLPPLEATDRILWEIAAVGHRLETLDYRISELKVASSSIQADIAGFRETVHNLDQLLTIVEDHVAVLPGQEAESISLRAKVTDLENRSCRDNKCLFGIPEHKEGSEVKTFLKNLLPEITGLEYLPPLEFQRELRIGPLHKVTSDKPRPIIV